MRITVLGGGSWGTALAGLFAEQGRETTLWLREPELAARIRTTRINDAYLPGIVLPEALRVEHDLPRALAGSGVLVLAVPCQFSRAFLVQARPHLPHRPVVVCASKGIEVAHLATMHQVVEEALHDLTPMYAMLSGPSFAMEVARGLPTAVALGCVNEAIARELQGLLSGPMFRIYTNPDVLGVELGGALKNVMAIAVGMLDGLEAGLDARAALITRGLAEMSRLGVAMGAQERTFMGLAGMGDLVLTCTGALSRNRTVGLELGQGKSLAEITASRNSVAEGVATAQSMFLLGQRHGVELPIAAAVHAVLYEDAPVRETLSRLMARGLKGE
ncbi:NAD(P)H-dependent glycerol-3-phosphate dehydrogenase [Megalodesulfovibrio paquesii]